MSGAEAWRAHSMGGGVEFGFLPDKFSSMNRELVRCYNVDTSKHGMSFCLFPHSLEREPADPICCSPGDVSFTAETCSVALVECLFAYM